MRILILVLSCKEPPYDTLRHVQERTWDAVKVPGVETFFYNCDAFETMPLRLKQAFQLTHDEDWNYIFRTNASSYVDKQRLVEFAEKLPYERLYCGIDGGGFASGSGFFLSPDCVEILREELPDMTKPNVVEDELVGRVLGRNEITVTPGQRYDYWHWQQPVIREIYRLNNKDEAETIRRAYHVRCKSDTGLRDKDVIAMEAVHAIKMEG